jgi:hypothetical protein
MQAVDHVAIRQLQGLRMRQLTVRLVAEQVAVC